MAERWQMKGRDAVLLREGLRKDLDAHGKFYLGYML